MHALSPHRHAPSPTTTRRGAFFGWLDPAEPHPYRGPFTRWPRAADCVLALAVFAGSLVAVTISSLADGDTYRIGTIGELPAGPIILLAVAAVSLLSRRRHPIAVAAVVMAIMVGWAVAGYGDGQDLALVVAMYAVGCYTADYRHGVAAVAVAIGVSVLGTLIDGHQRIDLAPAFLLTVLPWYVGRQVRNRGDYLVLLRERAERLEHDQQLRSRQAVANERARLARELHDVVAHQVSMMTIQAGAAKTIARDDLDTAITAMADVEHAGRQTIGELRHLLGVLRADTPDSDMLGPQPSLADLPALVHHLEHTGASVEVGLAELPNRIPASVHLSGYRIVQESFTNIIKHAGPSPSVSITTAVDGLVLSIEIINTIGSVAQDLPHSGYGIAGMEERASLLGGTLTATRQPPGRYRIHARLPLQPEQP